MKFHLTIIGMLLLAATSGAQTTLRWSSAATGGEIEGRVLLPAEGRDPQPAVVYLTGLSIPRIGQESDESILEDLKQQGFLVLILDYAKHAGAISPKLNADMLKLRREIAGQEKSLLKEHKIDPNRLFILCEGFQLMQNVEFARDGDRVLAMDIVYPSRPSREVPVLLEITCDNENRMGSFSLLVCRDTLLEGAQAAGFATAMVDHPVRPPYKGLDDPMPQSVDRMEAAVDKLHSLQNDIGTSDKIGAIGFSRGGPFAAILAATGVVQAALVHGNRYDYLDLRADDPMLARFEQAWGPLDEKRQAWAIHGAVQYLTGRASPMFLNTSNTESPEYRDGLDDLSRRLDSLNVEHVYQVDDDNRGHRVTTDPKTLLEIYEFFARHLGAEAAN